MEKNSIEILKEIEAEIASLKEKVRALEEQVAEYQKVAAGEAAVEEDLPVEADFTDMEFGVADLPEEVVPAVEETVQEPEVLPEPEPEPEAVAEPEPESAPATEPEPEPETKPEPAAEPAPAETPGVDTTRMPWRLDKPGLPVKNIRSGISLYDRALFIGTLFKEDFALYDRTIGDLNAMGSLDEAVSYILANFPDWNLGSDIVYNFMMAIRKKLG